MNKLIAYRAGNKIKYTGKTEILHGVIWYQFKILDGAQKGQIGVTSLPPKSNNRVWNINKGFNN